jgi:hypothetical protein
MGNIQNCDSYINVASVGLVRRRNMFPVRYEQYPSRVLNKRGDDE